MTTTQQTALQILAQKRADAQKKNRFTPATQGRFLRSGRANLPQAAYDITDAVTSIWEQASESGAIHQAARTTDMAYSQSGGIISRNTNGSSVKKYTGETKFKSKAEAQAALDQYASQFASAGYDISDAVTSIWEQAGQQYGGSQGAKTADLSFSKSGGIINRKETSENYLDNPVKKYTGQTFFFSEQEAQSAIEKYLDSANAALPGWGEGTMHDTLGREQKITGKQYQQIIDAEKTHKTWSGTYNVLPEEVANSQADWWINDRGLFEWVPITQGDKAHLEKINKQRKQLGQAATTTLTLGAAPSQEYSEKWYSEGGKHKISAPSGSGSLKLKKMREGSATNPAASAISGTAQTKKIDIISPTIPKNDPLIGGGTKIRDPFEAFNKQNARLLDQIAAVGQERTKIATIGVEITGLTPPKKGTLDKINTKVASIINLPSLGEIATKRDNFLKGFEINATQGNITRDYTLLDAQKKQQSKIQSNPITGGVLSFTEGEYNSIRSAPVSYACMTGATIVTGAAGGALLKGGGMVARTGLTKMGLPKAANLVEPATHTILGATVLKEISEIKSVEQGLEFGKDIALMGSGFKIGQKSGLRTFDTMRTSGAKEVPIESIVKKEVLAGQEVFPLTKKGGTVQDVIKSFEDPTTGKLTGYHATTGNMGKTPVVRDQISRPDDVPGLYISPAKQGTSPHFLRSGGDGATSSLKYMHGGLKEVKIGILEHSPQKIKTGVKKLGEGLLGTPTPLEPNVMKISVSNVARLPPAERTAFVRKGGKQVPAAAQEWLASPDAQKGTAYLTPILENTVRTGARAEAEAVIAPHTQLTRVPGEKRFFEFGGRKVEVRDYKTIEPTKVKTSDHNTVLESTKGGDMKPITAGELSKSYSYTAQGPRGVLSDVAPRFHRIQPDRRIPGVQPDRRVPGIQPDRRIPGVQPDRRVPGIQPERRVPDIVPSQLRQPKRNSYAKMLLGWGARTKKHYVLDPDAFVFGKKRKGR